VQFFIGHINAPLMRFLEQVNAAQKGALARARAADDTDHITRVGGQRHTFEHLVGAKTFVDVFDLEFERGGGVHDGQFG
jgi:hypothetical protein